MNELARAIYQIKFEIKSIIVWVRSVALMLSGV